MSEFAKAEELIVGLHDIGEITYYKSPETFKKLHSGRHSPTLVSTRGVMSYSEAFDMPIKRQKRIAKLTVAAYVFGVDTFPMKPDHIINVPQAINPLMGAIAKKGKWSQLYLRTPGEKGYGEHAPVAGRYGIEELVVPIDNAVSTAKSMIDIIPPIEHKADLVIPGFVALVDREEGGRAALHEQGYILNSVFGMRFITDVLVENKRITSTQAEWTRLYIDTYDVPINTVQ